jgi:hypothetical protein
MNLFESKNIIRIDKIFPLFLIENVFSYEGINFIRGFTNGWGNGYVGLPFWHPYYKIHYDNIPVKIHGGLTFSEWDEDENLWVIGFDTAHSGDNKDKNNYEYVLNETYYLLEQCLNIKEVQRIIKLNKLING